MPARVEVDLARLRHLYVDQEMTAIEVGEVLGCSGTTVFARLKELGIEPRPGRARVTADGHATIDWQRVALPRAVEIIESYDTEVTLRQVFYRLVSEQLIRNKQSIYSRFSTLSAEWRREGRFPDLLDMSRRIEVDRGFRDPADALAWVVENYTIDRTVGQSHDIYLVCEKRGMAAQLSNWFDDRCLPVVCCGGFASQSLVKNVAKDIAASRRPPVLIYAGDFDADGVYIDVDFHNRLRDQLKGRMFMWHRVALDQEQVAAYDLPENPGKDESPRRAAFEEMYGDNIQVELDALDPDVLRELYEEAVADYWDDDVYESALDRESSERDRLKKWIQRGGPQPAIGLV